MGELLQIRVMAYTPDTGAVERAYPQLAALAWPAGNDYAPAKRGLLELVDALAERLRYGDVSKAMRAAFLADASAIVTMKEALEDALARWDASQANKLSVKIEDALAELDGKMRTV